MKCHRRHGIGRVAGVCVAAAAWLAGGTAIAAVGDVTITSPSASLEVDDTFTSTLAAEAPAEGIAGFQIRLVFDADVVVIQEIRKPATGPFAQSSLLTSGALDGGNVLLLGDLNNPDAAVAGVSMLAEIVWKAVGGGETALDIQVEAVSDRVGGDFTTNPTDGFIEVGGGTVEAPTITSLNPNAGPQAGGTSVTIAGTGFTGATEVWFGTVMAPNFTVDSPTQITATSPAATTAGQVPVTVVGPGGTSNGVTFTYRARPTLTSVNPDSGPLTGGTNVVLTGTNFTGATAVRFGTTNATAFTVVNATTINATSPAGTTAGSVPVTVITPFGTSNGATFTYQGEGPTISSINPDSGPIKGGTTVTITGTEFTGATAVRFGATNATSFTVNGAMQITATSPAHDAGQVLVTVVTPDGTSDGVTFTYTGPALTGINPDSGPAEGGTDVTLTGARLTGATAVRFGTVHATSFTVVNATTITATSPEATTAGDVPVTVVTSEGTSNGVTFTYEDDNGDPWDPEDDTPAGATQLGAPTSTEARHPAAGTVVHTLDQTEDTADWFKVNLEQGKDYNFNSVGGQGDSLAYLVRAQDASAFHQGNHDLAVGSNDDGGGGMQFSLYHRAAASGLYYLVVMPFLEEGNSPRYILKYSEANTSGVWDNWDPEDESPDAATVLPTPTQQEQASEEHTLSEADSLDWFRVDLSDGGVYNFNSFGGSGDPAVWAVHEDDLDAFLSGSSTVQFWHDDDSGGSYQFNLTFAAQKSGRHYLAVSQSLLTNTVDARYRLRYTEAPINCGHQPCLKSLEDHVHEEALPLSLSGNPQGVVGPEAMLSVHLVADAPIDPASIHVAVEGPGYAAEGARWMPTDPEGKDGWAAFTPQEPMPIGKQVVLTTSAKTLAGGDVTSVTAIYQVEQVKAAAGAKTVVVNLEPTAPALPDLVGTSASGAYRIEPAGAFAAPLKVRLPLTVGIAPESVRLFYLSESVQHPGWYPAENVQGFLVADSLRITTDDKQQAWAEFEVHHSGVVQLAEVTEVRVASLIALNVGLEGSRALWLALLGVVLTLLTALGCLAGKRTRVQ